MILRSVLTRLEAFAVIDRRFIRLPNFGRRTRSDRHLPTVIPKFLARREAVLEAQSCAVASAPPSRAIAGHLRRNKLDNQTFGSDRKGQRRCAVSVGDADLKRGGRYGPGIVPKIEIAIHGAPREGLPWRSLWLGSQACRAIVRLRANAPIRANPVIIRAQFAGSGTAVKPSNAANWAGIWAFVGAGTGWLRIFPISV